MKFGRALGLTLCLLSCVLTLSGCWNYREVEDISIVSGFAIDREDGNYALTFEIIKVAAGRESVIDTYTVTSEGETVFDAIRKTIKLTGKRLYFSQMEIIILSEEIAREGIAPIIDWIGRDAEPRYSLHFLVSREKTAKEILGQHSLASDILCYGLNDMLRAQKSLCYATSIEEWQFMVDLAEMGISPTLPTVCLKSDNDKLLPEISGTAVFKEDKLQGFIDGEETKAMLFVKDEIKGGVLVAREERDGSVTNISLEILSSKTKLKPSYSDGRVTIEIETDTDVAIDENGGPDNYGSEALLPKLKQDTEAMLEKRIKALVKKTQEEYDSDIFGFGKAVRMKMPKLWKQQLEPNWNELYKNVAVEVHSTINVRNTAFETKPVKVGD